MGALGVLEEEEVNDGNEQQCESGKDEEKPYSHVSYYLKGVIDVVTMALYVSSKMTVFLISRMSQILKTEKAATFISSI